MKKNPPKKKTGRRDMVTYHRRFHMLLFILKRRITSYKELQDEFGITAGMVRLDLDFLETIYGIPLIRERGKPLQLVGEWSFVWPHFTALENHRLLLIRMYLPEEKQHWIDEMIREYGNPALLLKEIESDI